MIELFVLFGMTRMLLEQAAKKGVPSWWAAFAPLLWIVGEVMGGFMGAYLGLDWKAYYPLALLYGAVGATTGWVLVAFHPFALEPRRAGFTRRR